MNIVAGIQIYEEEDFIKPTLLSLLQLCDKIILVEGCWINTLKQTNSKRSRDKTIDIIKDIIHNHDPDNRIELHFFNGKNQQEHRIHILNLSLKYKPDWYLQGDGDEIFHEKHIPILKDIMNTTDKHAINPNHKLFWNDLIHYENWRPSGRFFKFKNFDTSSLTYHDCNSYGHKNDPNYFKLHNILVPNNICIYHPSYVKNYERQCLKWIHRTLDDKRLFPHALDTKLKMVYRKTFSNPIDFQNSLQKLPLHELPLVLRQTL
tara:strand:- start:1059 stop:1844 length:786 start_codon:yes stop_codon:yes gene_type:complete